MPQPVISVENLSKRYLVGHHAQRSDLHSYTALRDVMGRELRNFGRKALDVVRGRQVVQGDTVEEFWALKDVSFNVREGEVLGIIGHNGAGKSTLLKVLSRITEPSSGRVTLRGRVASLLEVGTGFHPELSGRENIFLNGAILGMSRAEIRKRFDEIVAFAEVEKFLDTPVKRYSSGMYVRLAFAVAAHLEPEILIIDEVLAVGDAEFQKKCLGKMDEVSRGEGRTVLFVSHNMEGVLKLCDQALLLHGGNLIETGDANVVVAAYTKRNFSYPPEVDLSIKPRPWRVGNKLRLARARIAPPLQDWSLPFGRRLAFDLSIDSDEAVYDAELGVSVFSAKGYEIASWTTTCSGGFLEAKPGRNVYRISYEDLTLLPGQYYLGIGIRSGKARAFEDYLPEAVPFDITVNSASAEMMTSSFRGSLVPRVQLSRLDKSSAQVLPILAK